MANMLSLAIRRFGTDYDECSNNHIRYNCPFCISKRNKADTDKKFYVNCLNGKFYCFKCHAKGKLSIELDLSSCSDVYERILNRVENGGETIENVDNVCNNKGDDTGLCFVPNIPIGKDTLAYAYCFKRGITDEMIDFYNIRLGKGDLFGRIVIPNKLYLNGSWTDMYSARSYLGQEPKYLNPDECDKSNIVFNLHNIEEGSDIYVVEGVLTAICAGKDAVAVYGCHPSETQINMIVSKKPKNIYCVLDNDAAGRKPNEELAMKFTELVPSDTNVYVVYMPEGIDAADVGEVRFKEYVRDNKIRSYNSIYTKLISYVKNREIENNIENVLLKLQGVNNNEV